MVLIQGCWLSRYGSITLTSFCAVTQLDALVQANGQQYVASSSSSSYLLFFAIT